MGGFFCVAVSGLELSMSVSSLLQALARSSRGLLSDGELVCNEKIMFNDSVSFQRMMTNNIKIEADG